MTSQADREAGHSLAWLHPGWAASGLGTGALGTATLMLARSFPGADWVEVFAFGLLCVALLLSVGAVVLYGYRFVRHRRALLADLNDPQLAPLFATLPGGLVVTAAGIAQLTTPLASPLPLAAVGVMGAIGLALSILVAAAFVIAMMAAGSGVVGSVTGVWFIPGTVVMLGVILLVSLSGPLGWMAPSTHEAGVLGGAGLGIGFGLTAVAGGMLAIRLIDRGTLPVSQQPSLFIVLSPLSIGAVATIMLIRQLVPADGGRAVWVVADLGATMLWGFALFWAAICVVVLVPVLRRGLAFSPSWWAFVFPVAAFAEATLRIGQVWPSLAVTWLGVAIWGVEVCIWAVVIMGLLRDTAAGRVSYR